jgi:hypothetical protein
MLILLQLKFVILLHEVCNDDDDCNGLTDEGLVFLNYYVDA